MRVQRFWRVITNQVFRQALVVSSMALALMSCGSEPNNSRWVFKHDGSAQCDRSFNRELSVNKQRTELVSAGIDVISSNCGEITSLEIASVCGAPTLRINVYEIPIENLQDTADLGFNNTDNITYRDIGCGSSLIPLF
ncbi:MAG: hypothetical protein P8176_12030 [Gammaproteobacteria bacterium]